MSYQTVELSFVGEESKSRSGYFSSQSSVNMYIASQRAGRTQRALHAWPGELSFSTTVGSNRGVHNWNGVLYQVSGNTLQRIASDGSRTNVGSIAGSGRCVFAGSQANLVIRDPVKTFVYDGSTVSEITDIDLEAGNTVALINNQFIYQGTGSRWASSDVGLPTSISGLNYATAESSGDDLLQIKTFNERLYFGGTDSIEVWYNSGVGSPPFDRVAGATSNVGIASSYTMANSEEFLYFLGSDRIVYKQSSYQPQSITTLSIARELRNAETVSDALGFVVKLDGQTFYIIQLVSAGITLAFSQDTEEWVRLSTGTELGSHLIDSYTYIYDKHLISDTDGNLFEWDFKTNTSNTNPLIRQRDTAPINGLALGAPGKRLLTSRIELLMEVGVGTATGQGVNPKVMISVSIDGGNSFDKEVWVAVGRTGQSLVRVEWYGMVSFYELVVRVRSSDPNFISFHSAAIDLRLDGY